MASSKWQFSFHNIRLVFNGRFLDVQAFNGQLIKYCWHQSQSKRSHNGHEIGYSMK